MALGFAPVALRAQQVCLDRTIRVDGVGAVAIGQTVAGVGRACRIVSDKPHLKGECEGCGAGARALEVLIGSDTVLAWVERDSIWRIDVTSAGLATADSLRVGTPLRTLLRDDRVRGASGEGTLVVRLPGKCGIDFILRFDRPDGSANLTAQILRGLPQDMRVMEIWVHSCSSYEGRDPDEALIRAARARYNQAIAQHDTVALTRDWLPEFSTVSSTNVQSIGRDIVRARIAELFRTRPDVVYVRSPDTIDVNASWGQAAESGHWTGRWTQADGVTLVGGRYFAKWRRVDGRWRLLTEVFVQTSCSGTSYCSQPP